MPSAGPDDDAIPLGDPLGRLIGPEDAHRFRVGLAGLTGGKGGSVALAVSGGPDSVALLLLCAAAFPFPPIAGVATVDHGLREGSAAEADAVARLCDRLGLRHTILPIAIPPGRGGLQARARAARYAALADWCPGRWLLTGHHRDDVAETLLMRLRRGSGVRGLARMPAARLLRPGVTLLRPLLDWSKAELLTICARANVSAIRDPSNHDPRFDRSAARQVIARSPWLDPAQLAAAATHLADADAALEWWADRAWALWVTEVGDAIVVDRRGLPHETCRRLVARAVDRLAGPDPARQVETMVEALDAGRHAMLGDVQGVPGDRWTFRRAPPRRGTERSS